MGRIIHLAGFIGEKTTNKLFEYAEAKGCVCTDREARDKSSSTGYFTDSFRYVKIEDIMTPLFDKLINELEETKNNSTIQEIV